MRVLLATIVLLLYYSAAHAEDMGKYLDDTKAMVRQGKYQDALDRFIWFHDHALEYDTGMYGVRLSFALNDWKRLGDVYPPALTALLNTRDTKTARLIEGKGNPNLFVDVSGISQTLGEDEKTLQLFQRLDREQSNLAKHCWFGVEDLVLANKAYDLAKKYDANPRRNFVTAKALYEYNVALYDGKVYGESFKRNNEDTFVQKTIQLIELATALAQSSAALEIQQKALALVEDHRLHEVTL